MILKDDHSCIRGEAAPRQLLRSKSPAPLLRSALLTFLFLVGITAIGIMVFLPKQLWLLPTIFTSLIRSATALPTSQHHAVNNSTKGSLGAVTSESTVCSGIGRDILLRGGNAADAMVGTTFCVGVIGMYHSGVGGGGFMLVRGSDGEYEFIDFRETAPAAAFQDMYNNNTESSLYGGLAR